MTSWCLSYFNTFGILWLPLSVGRSPTAPTTYRGVKQDEHNGYAHQIFEAGVIFVCQHIVEVAREDTYLVNDQLLWWQEKKMC